MNADTVTLDVREDFRSGNHPCDKIQQALEAVTGNRALRLLVPFKPVPLFAVAAKRGLGHHATQTGEGHWEVLFTPDAGAAQFQANPPAAGSACDCDGPPVSSEVIDMDARGLEPPQPMVKILGALSALPAGATLRAHTDRRPVHLYGQLEDRGFSGTSEEQADGSFITHIRRA